VITPWEVAALRAFDGQSKYIASRVKADGGVWCLTGRTIFVRAEILKNEAFYYDFAHEYWCGNNLNAGDDVFITRWVQHIMGWEIAVQDCPEATVTTTIKRDFGFAKQMIRWQRSTLIMLITHLFFEPGYRKLRRTYPYMARKMVERLMRPYSNLLYFCAFVVTMNYYPLTA
jgi:cellulose synthase/poly-beta-1,6-N-acetylglucosamine synthase-like glycosyltransferase